MRFVFCRLRNDLSSDKSARRVPQKIVLEDRYTLRLEVAFLPPCHQEELEGRRIGLQPDRAKDQVARPVFVLWMFFHYLTAGNSFHISRKLIWRTVL